MHIHVYIYIYRYVCATHRQTHLRRNFNHVLSYSFHVGTDSDVIFCILTIRRQCFLYELGCDLALFTACIYVCMYICLCICIHKYTCIYTYIVTSSLYEGSIFSMNWAAILRCSLHICMYVFMYTYTLSHLRYTKAVFSL